MKIALFILFLVDRGLKFYFINYGSHFLNLGVAFGAISTEPKLVIIIQLFITCLLILYFYRNNLGERVRYSLLAIILGSISNLIDRFMYNGVVDYIDLWIFPKFNLADIMIVVGVLLLIILELNEYFKNFKSRRVTRG
jgi:signal peptidase II